MASEVDKMRNSNKIIVLFMAVTTKTTKIRAVLTSRE